MSCVVSNCPPLAPQLDDETAELARGKRVHARRRLVEEEHLGVADQPAGEV
jgi:hypothetical protein